MGMPPSYPTKGQLDAMAAMQGCITPKSISMFHSDSGAIPKELRGSELVLPGEAASFFLTRDDLTLMHRCAKGDSLAHRDGAECIPCFVHMCEVPMCLLERLARQAHSSLAIGSFGPWSCV